MFPIPTCFLYRLATALVMPSLFESVSIPIYEAFQAGLPVCASNVVGLPEQVGEAALLFDPRNTESIAGTIRRVLTDRELRSKLAERGSRRISEMTFDRYATSLEEIIGVLLREGSRA